jgi:hypothetical protein
MIAVTALFALAACGQSSEAPKQAAAPAAPQGLMEQLERTSPEMQPVTAWQQLMTHAETMPACHEVRRTESRGIVPANASGPYAAHDGEWAFSVQCGPQLTTVHADPHQHWIIFFASGSTTSTIANCADAHGQDQCVAQTIPTAAAAATP